MFQLDLSHITRHWLCVTGRYLSKSRLDDSTSNRKVSQCVKKRNKSFSFVQNFIYNLLFNKVGICGLLEFVVITGRHAHVLHCIEKGDILEYTIVRSLLTFGEPSVINLQTFSAWNYNCCDPA